MTRTGERGEGKAWRWKPTGCWATTHDGFRCMKTDGMQTSIDYGMLFEHCYEHLGRLLSVELYPDWYDWRSK